MRVIIIVYLMSHHVGKGREVPLLSPTQDMAGVGPRRNIEGQLHTQRHTTLQCTLRAPRLDAMVHTALALAGGVGCKHTRHKTSDFKYHVQVAFRTGLG